MNERIHSDFPSFDEFVRQRLQELLSSDSKAVDLAKELEIPYTSLNRMKNFGCKKTSVHAKNLLFALAKDNSHLEALLENYFPDEAKIWKSAYSIGEYNIKSFSKLKLIESDSTYFYIDAFSGFRHGLALKTTDTLWGDSGMEKAQDLLDGGHLDVDNKWISRKNRTSSYGGLNTLKTVIGYLVKDFRLDNIHQGLGSLSNIIGCVNREGLLKIREICSNAAKEVLAVITSEKYQGSIPAHASFIAGQMKGSDQYSRDIEELSKKGQS